jgi:ribosome maturation factor RimP
MISKEKIEKLIQEKLIDTDAFLVELKISADNRISVYLDGMSGVTIDFCVAVSRNIEGNLDREVEDFELEVSSAGIGIPFKVLQQYQKNTGKQVEVLTNQGLKVEGELTDVDEQGFAVRYEKKVLVEGKKRKQLQEFTDRFAYDEVKSTKEVLKVK